MAEKIRVFELMAAGSGRFFATFLLMSTLVSCDSPKLDGKNAEVFVEGLKSMAEQAKESQDITAGTEMRVRAIAVLLQNAMLVDDLQMVDDRSGATKAQMKARVLKEGQTMKVLKAFDGISLDDFSSQNDRYRRAMQDATESRN
jgi:hypothetical protein